MNTKQTIRKILFVLFWTVIGSGMITLLVAAIGRKNKEICTDYQIEIKGAQHNFFVNEKDILKLVTSVTSGPIKGKHLSAIKMKKVEDLLEDNEWIQEAEVWIDNKKILNITVTEREPVARIFTVEGNSFYIDSTTKRMSLSVNRTARVPVFTGFPEKRSWNSKDSALMMDIKSIACYVQQDTFWNSQVAQLDIVNCGFNCWQFEMIPVVGNHIIKLGNAENIDKKFEKLFVFYKQVLSKSGFDKYPVIDVQYKEQVIGLKEKPTGSIDSAQLRRNIEKLMMQSRVAQNDSIDAVKTIVKKTVNNINGSKNDVEKNKAISDTDTKPVSVKTINPPKVSGTDNPKALMTKKN